MITLYDIASKLKPQCFSSNTWKARFVLNYKGIPYQTVWMQYDEIKPKLKEIGIPPYTAPTISIPQEDGSLKFICDSVAIAEYLDEHYPDTPKVFPPGTRPLQASFIDLVIRLFMTPLRPIVMPLVPVNTLQTEAGAAAFRALQEQKTGMPLSEFSATGEKRQAIWKQLEANLNTLDGILQKSDAEGVWIMGDKPCFADFVLGGSLMWLAQNGPQTADEGWQVVKEWNGGRWRKILENLSPLMHDE